MPITMPRPATFRALAGLLFAAVCLGLAGTTAHAHGGVVLEEDLCVIQMGFLRAHFTIYQPETRANEEYCEDIPDVTQTIFVMEYLHASLRDMALDFRIIRDVTGTGVYARWDDVATIDDLDAATVFYLPPRRRDAPQLTIEHRFDEPGWYIGIVTTRDPDTDRIYRTVFPFEVGTNWGYLPLFVLLGVAAQAGYLLSTGAAQRWWSRLAGSRS